MRHSVLFFLVLVLVGSNLNQSFAASKTPPQKIHIVTTIKPITNIVTAILGDSRNIQQLIPSFVSPHDYSFKPSDIRNIKSANVIFRIDEDMEISLNSAFALRNQTSKLVSLADNPQIEILGFSANTQNKGTSSHQHNHGNIDFHIWTSPKNAITMANNIALVLGQINPTHKKTYLRNLKQFTQSIQSTSNKLKLQLLPLKEKPYIVFHNSWQYFSNYYGLQEPNIISFHHSLTPGIKTIMKTRKKITSKKTSCIFSDPTITAAQIDTLIENLAVKTVRIDSMQSTIPSGKNSYKEWLINTASLITHCLK